MMFSDDDENQEHSCITLTLDSSRERGNQNLTRNEYERGIFMVTTTKA